MIDEREHKVADIVQAAGGRLVSRIRLQKFAYLLDQMGARSGFDFSYHHYGPYSRDLDCALLDADAFDLIKEEFGRRQADGARYSIFLSVEKDEPHEYSYLSDPKLRAVVEKHAKTNIMVLELAATAHWLDQAEKVEDWKTEIRRRKGVKCDDGRLEAALDLLKEFQLPPAI